MKSLRLLCDVADAIGVKAVNSQLRQMIFLLSPLLSAVYAPPLTLPRTLSHKWRDPFVTEILTLVAKEVDLNRFQIY